MSNEGNGRKVRNPLRPNLLYDLFYAGRVGNVGLV